MDEHIFESFYRNEFKQTKTFCKHNPYAKKIINFARSLGLKVVLATNPVFPRIAVKTRMKFVGLEEGDFDYISSYDNAHYCKLKSEYYQELLNKLGLKPEEVIMFGNNEVEDAKSATKAGISTYLIGDCIIIDETSKNRVPYHKMEEVTGIILKEFEERKNA